MTTAANALAGLWLLSWALHGATQLMRHRVRSVHYIQIVLFIFCGLPLLLDATYGPPDWLYPGFVKACGDEATALAYCAYVCWVPILFHFVAGARWRPEDPMVATQVQGPSLRRLSRLILHGVTVLPVLLVLASDSPEVFLVYPAVFSPDLTPMLETQMNWILLSCNLALLAAFALWASGKRLFHSRLLLLLPGIAVAVWIQGKRSLLVMGLFLIMFVVSVRGTLRGVRLVALVAVVFILAILFSSSYQTNVRGIPEGNRYLNFRVDYGRDHIIKQTLYAELHPDKLSILEYRGQSLLFDITAFVPRELWADKPLPYALYATAAALGAKPQMFGWGFTTSWLEEAIANLSWFGVIFGPLLPALICRASDSTRNTNVRLLGTLVSALLLTLQLSAFLALIAIWAILTVVAWRRDWRLPAARQA